MNEKIRGFVAFGLSITATLVPLSAQSVPAPAGSAPSGKASEVAPQTDKAAAGGTASADGSAQKLDTVVVTADESILPTQRDITSIYGLGLNILDTPRSVSEITQEQLQARNVEDITQLGQFSSGVYSPSRYGLETVPVIRGDLGELYQNGQRLRFNRNGFPVSFNAVEAADLVKGPAPAPFGAGSQVGGYVNFVTKEPYQDALHGNVNVQVGDVYFRPEDNWNRYQWNIDVGGPIIKDKLAYRVSYLGREDKAYYQNTRNDTEDFFGALDYTPTQSVHVQFTSQYYADRYNEAIGVNRVTQGLIDDGTYVTGPPGGSGFGAPAPYYGFRGLITPTGTQKIYPYYSLNAPNDSARSQVGIGQLITTINVDDGLDIVNSDLGEYNQHRKLSHYQYEEYQPDAVTFENRTEIHYHSETPYADLFGSSKKTAEVKSRDPKDGGSKADEGVFLPGSLASDVNAGLTERYEYTKAYTEFFNEDIGSFDLTAGDPILPNGFATGTVPIPGTNYTTDPTRSNGATLESTLVQVGPFYQQNFKFNNQWAFLVGARLDVNFAESNDPLNPSFGDSLTSVLHGYNASITYKPTEWSTAYATYNYNQAYEGAYDSGGIGLAGGRIPINNFHKESTLYEVGMKFDLLNHTLYASADGFVQKRNFNDRFGNNNQVLARGAEVDMSYQPDKHFSLNGNFTWIEENYNNLADNGEGTLNYQDLYPAGYQIPGGGVGTGRGAPNFGNGGNHGDYKVPGQPNILFNAYATYKFNFGLGFSVGPQVQGEQNANLYGSLVIPAQFTWNGSVFYEHKDFKVKLDFLNFTDERNLVATDPSFAGNDLILYERPFSMRATFSYKF